MRTKRVIQAAIIVTTLFTITALPCQAQFSDLCEVIKELKRTSLSIEVMQYDSASHQWQLIPRGSAFLTKNTMTGKTYAVTAAHVLDNIRKDQKLVVGANFKEGKVSLNADLEKIDALRDIAFLHIGSPIYKLSFSPEPDQAYVPMSSFAQDSLIVEGTGVLVIGYPLSLGAYTTRNQPVSRIGIVAQSVQSGTFLIDGIASHGNSGSPVFDSQTQRLLGIVSEAQADQIQLFNDNGNLSASLPYNSGIAKCISAQTIQKLIP